MLAFLLGMTVGGTAAFAVFALISAAKTEDDNTPKPNDRKKED